MIEDDKGIKLALEKISGDLKILMNSIKNFYKLSVTGNLSSNIQPEYKKSTMEWETSNNCYNGYMGLRIPAIDCREKEKFMKKDTDFSHSLYNLKVNYIERESISGKEINGWSKGTIIDFLARSRVARYADCHGLAIESALLLNHIKNNFENNLYEKFCFKVVRNKERGHTFLVGESEEKIVFMFDCWERSIVTNKFKLHFTYNKHVKESTDKVFTNFAKEKCEYHVNEVILNDYLKNKLIV